MTCETAGPTDKVTLACITSDFSPASALTFQWRDSSGRSITDFITYPAVQSSGSQSYRSISQVTVNMGNWDARSSYSCSATHPSQSRNLNAHFQKPAPPKSPTVTLLPVYTQDSTPDTLICFIRDFNPKSLGVTWRVNGRDVTGSSHTWLSEKQASNLYSASSIMNVDRASWDRNEEYKCEVRHLQNTFSPKTSREQTLDKPCLEVILNPPKVRQLFINNQAVLDCIITGGEKAAVEGARVTWTVNGKDSSGSDSQTTQDGRLFRKTSTLTLAETQWFSDGGVQCSVKQINSKKPPIQKSINLIKRGSRAPTLILSNPSEEDGEFATLMCLVTGFTPRDVYVMWKVDNGPFVEGVTAEPVRGDSGTFSVTSLFKVPLQKWKSQSQVGCHVKHMGNGGTPTTKSLHRTTDIDKPCLEVTLNPPKVRQLFINNQAVLDCIITGGEKAAVEGARVTWTVNGKDSSGSDSQTTQDGRLFRKTSTLTLAETQWFSDGGVQCSVKQINSKKPPIQKSFNMIKSGSRAPTLILSNPSEEDGEFATLMCLVTGFTPRDVYVMWKVDNGPFVEGVTTEPVRGDSGTFSVTSLFKVPLQKWKSQSQVGCHVKHMGNGGTPTTKSLHRTTDIDKPCLEVTLNPPKVRQLFINNQAVLDCIITGGERAAVEEARVTWTVNGKNASGSDSQTTQDGRLFRKTSTLTLAETQWFSDGGVQCSVKQINSKKPPIQKSINIIKSGSSAPTLILSNPSEEDGEFVTLMCLVTGFTPRDVYVMWKVDNGPFVEGVTTEPVRGDSGTFSVTSLFKVPLQKWKSQSQVGCHVKHIGNGGTPTTKSLHRTTDIDKPCLEVTLKPPKVRQLFINNQAVLDCIITGGERAAVEGARVTWTVNGKNSSGSDSQTTQDGRLFRKTSTLTLAETQWFSDGGVQCSVKQINSKKPPIQKSVNMIKNGSEGLQLFITKLPKKDDPNFVPVMCLVTYLPPRDIYVMWRVSNGSYEEGVTSEPVRGDNGTFSVASLFRVPTLKWESYSRVGCHVKHMVNGGSPNITTISKEDVPPLETESVLHCNDEGEEEDELGSLWSTTLSFITLFLCSLIYSTVLSLIKVVQL
ncbi:hypothetical protein GJAV_G00268020 [Gymnothorax javanicus]|nr:hypothetical protein GJAV_G00268020 [Gymnothorax javanicus]